LFFQSRADEFEFSQLTLGSAKFFQDSINVLPCSFFCQKSMDMLLFHVYLC
jgi:hypothetical protein